ncbi:hypothetical protein WN48_02942 [Eufriesea mexicana]|nr:hypothetical protein WN48_02942 [Eufriesea mexicana]
MQGLSWDSPVGESAIRGLKESREIGKGRDAFCPGPASGLISKATLAGPALDWDTIGWPESYIYRNWRFFVGLRESPGSRNPLVARRGHDSSATCENEMSTSRNSSLLRLNQEGRRLSIEKAATICDKMNFRGAFSLTKTATGILFKFSNIDDFQAVYKKGFHKVTGARFYKKVAIPCRPAKTFTVYVLDVPEELPEEDIRHALYKYRSIVEVTRLPLNTGTVRIQKPKLSKERLCKERRKCSRGQENRELNPISLSIPVVHLIPTPCHPTIELICRLSPLISLTTRPLTRCLLCELVKAINDKLKSEAHNQNEPATIYTGPPVIRVTLASVEETSTLLSRGLDFYGATYFPTETPHPAAQPLAKYKNNRWLELAAIGAGQRVRDLLPVFDNAGFNKLPPPASRLIKPQKN